MEKDFDNNAKVTYLPKLNPGTLQDVEDELKKIKLRINYSRANSGVGRTQVFGMINKRGKGVGPAANNDRYPELYKQLMSFGEKNIPIQFDGIQLNNNYESTMHVDRNNVGESVIVSFGNYEGGELVIEGKVYDTRYQPILFEGSKYRHWNQKILSGDKYSLVFFKNNKVQALKAKQE
jgi:hypothetical protein